MGLLTDFIIADESEARYVTSLEGKHFDKYPTLQYKNVDIVKLAALHQIIEPEAEVYGIGDADWLGDPDGDGPMICRIPERLRDAIARLSLSKVRDMAEAWSQTDEMKFDRWSAGDCREVLSGLCRFCGKARTLKKPVLLWICL